MIKPTLFSGGSPTVEVPQAQSVNTTLTNEVGMLFGTASFFEVRFVNSSAFSEQSADDVFTGAKVA